MPGKVSWVSVAVQVVSLVTGVEVAVSVVLQVAILVTDAAAAPVSVALQVVILVTDAAAVAFSGVLQVAILGTGAAVTFSVVLQGAMLVTGAAAVTFSGVLQVAIPVTGERMNYHEHLSYPSRLLQTTNDEVAVVRQYQCPLVAKEPPLKMPLSNSRLPAEGNSRREDCLTAWLPRIASFLRFRH